MRDPSRSPATPDALLASHLIASSQDGLLAFDTELRYLVWNAAMERIAGLPASEVIGRRGVEVFPFLAETGEIERIARVLGGEPFETKDRPYDIPETGRRGYFDASYAPLRDATGAIIGVMGIVRDVTARHDAEASLHASNAGLKRLNERIVAHVPAGIAYLDHDFVYRWHNERASASFALLGLNPEHMAGRPITEAFPRSENLPRMLDAMRSTHRPFQGVAAYGVAGPEQRPLYWDYAFVPLIEDERFAGLLIIFSEATERVEHDQLQQAQIRKLQELDRLKGDFLSAASHELRTPLTAIEGYAEFLEDEVAGPLGEQQRAFVRQIQEGAWRLRQIVDDLLDFARLEAGRFQLSLQRAELAALIRQEVALMRPTAEAAGISVTVELPAAPVRALMDPARVGQVLRNLIGNALKFSAAGSEVRLRVASSDAELRVEIRDAGIGIAPAQHGRVFEKFFQVDAGNTRAHGGTGLGLAICRSLVEAHGGAIGVESALGEGATFWFTLPRDRNAAPVAK